jgi:hypothetical protein
MIQVAQGLLEEHSELLRDRLAYYLLPRAKERYLTEVAKYDDAGLPVIDEADLYADIGFLPLHLAESFGRLRLMNLEERPGPRDIVIYPTLPNELPRVAGIITGVRQTPLSHVNLRAIQDDVPNAYIADFARNEQLTGLLDRYVHYKVDADGYEVREATAEEVERHFEALRPREVLFPARDLTEKTIRPLREIAFTDGDRFGRKASNLATLRTLYLEDVAVPDGLAVPFSFYDAFMEHNGLYEAARRMIAAPGFQTDSEVRDAALAEFRKTVKKGQMPQWMLDAIGDAQAAFPEGSSIRCRSSTNNEDLISFSGAGLYSSFTHRPKEGHLSKSIKQVYASMWNYRAFEEREFGRIDHFASAMGVLLHLNEENERANGVAVTEDVAYRTGAQQSGRSYYVNAQVGEDLVTNPSGDALSEELLLNPTRASRDVVVQRSSRVAGGGALLDVAQINLLRRSLGVIHSSFAQLYEVPAGARFAMEVEFKVTAEGALQIKQARPWVY